MTLSANDVRGALGRMKRSGQRIFGSDLHKFALKKPLALSEIARFERQYNVQLPADYKDFLANIGNGGAGPYYGIFELGKMDGIGTALQSWSENNGIIGTLAEAFPLTVAWNDVAAMPAEAEPGSEELETFERWYWDSSRVNGAMPICHLGCAQRIWLVLTGAEAGHLWRDDRTDYGGLYPVTLADGARATFSSWYRHWLENPLVVVNR